MQGEIKVEIEGDLMVVSLHGTSYRAIYFKSPLEPKLIQAPNLTVEKEGSTTHKEFEAMAWKAAIAKARVALDCLSRIHTPPVSADVLSSR